MPSHPDRIQLTAFLSGLLSETDRISVEQHVQNCDVCCNVMSQIPDDALHAQLRGADTDADEVRQETLSTGSPPNSRLDIPAALQNHPRYRILAPLGKGGMGMVYKAEHRMMDRVVALKVIDHRLVDNVQAVERFRVEVKAAAQLSHPNIVHAYDAEQADDLHFLVMEYVDGISLCELVKRNGPLPVRQACSIVRRVAQGLQHAFEHRMVHRDIKPQNIMVARDGKIRILDFGLARLSQKRLAPDSISEANSPVTASASGNGLTQTGSVLGTPDFMAPEQAANPRKADIRADIYSLGCTYYFLLTGHPPYSGESVLQKLLAHSTQTPPPIDEQRDDVPADVIAVVARMMERDPEQRFQTPQELVEAIEPCVRSMLAESDQNSNEPPAQRAVKKPVPIQPSLRDRPSTSKISNTRFAFLTAAAGAIVVAAVVWIMLSQQTPPTKPGQDSTNTTNVTPDRESRESITPAEPSTTRDWVDLVASADSSQSLAGEWKNDGRELRVNAVTAARTFFSYTPSEQYDLEVEFTRHTGVHSIALIFQMNGQQATFEVDAWGLNLWGIQDIAGQDVRVNATRVDSTDLINGDRYTVRVSVRQNQVDAFVNGRHAARYTGDGSDLSLNEKWVNSPGDMIGIGAYEAETTFHRVRIRQVDGLNLP